MDDSEAGLAGLSAAVVAHENLRIKFKPIYEHHFPTSWLVVLARALRLSKTPSFARFGSELQQIRDEAWQVIEQAQISHRRVYDSHADQRTKDMAVFTYRQVHHEGTEMILLHEFAKAMREGDPDDKAPEMFVAMQHSQREAVRNADECKRYMAKRR